MAVVFFFDNPKMGGGPGLIIHLAEYLIQQGEDVKLALHPKSPVSEKLKSKGLPHKFISILDIEAGREVEIDENDVIVVFHLSTILGKLMRKNPRIVFYNIFPDHILKVNDYKFGLEFSRKTKYLIRKMVAHHALFFMDSEGVNALWQKYALQLASPIYLPVPVPDFGPIRYQEQPFPKMHEVLTLTYIGRAEKWKVYPLQKVLEDINAAGKFRSYRVIIVTDDAKSFKSTLKVPDNMPLQIEYHQNVFGEQLEKLLLEHSDLHVAMGVACIDGAKLGIPSLLVDPSLEQLPINYRYRWLFESTGFSLGRLIDANCTVLPGATMSTLLDSMMHSEFRHEVSVQGYQYVYRNHRSSECGKKFLNAVKQSNLRLRDIRGLVIYFSGFHRIFKGASFLLRKGNVE